MSIYRCTRNRFADLSILERQGYYLETSNGEMALKIMQQKFPQDKEGFTVDLWLGEKV